MKVNELIEILSKVDRNVEVKCRWDGYSWDVDGIYMDDGILVIDSEENWHAPAEMLYEGGSTESCK